MHDKWIKNLQANVMNKVPIKEELLQPSIIEQVLKIIVSINVRKQWLLTFIP